MFPAVQGADPAIGPLPDVQIIAAPFAPDNSFVHSRLEFAMGPQNAPFAAHGKHRAISRPQRPLVEFHHPDHHVDIGRSCRIAKRVSFGARDRDRLFEIHLCSIPAGRRGGRECKERVSRKPRLSEGHEACPLSSSLGDKSDGLFDRSLPVQVDRSGLHCRNDKAICHVSVLSFKGQSDRLAESSNRGVPNAPLASLGAAVTNLCNGATFHSRKRHTPKDRGGKQP